MTIPSLACDRVENGFLELLPKADFERIVEHSSRVQLSMDEIIHEPGVPTEIAYFPLSCVACVVVPLRDGSTIEVAMIGPEGMTGLGLLAEHGDVMQRIIVQVPGEALQVPVEFLRSMLAETGWLAKLAQRYALTVTHQAGQSAACNVRHSVGERLCRWLLMTHDRVGGDQFPLTQEIIGVMLGVRRQSVSGAAATLQRSRLISYSRGHVEILDRSGLEQASCECYAEVCRAYDEVMTLPGGTAVLS